MSRTKYKASRTRQAAEDEFPLAQSSIEVRVDVAVRVDMPPAAVQRLALRELRRLVGDLEARDLTLAAPQTEAVRAAAVSPEPPAVPAPAPRVDADGLDGRIVRSAHRLVLAVAQSHGSATVAELAGTLAAPTIARLLDPATPGGQYFLQFVTVAPEGRTRRLTLTPVGRVLATRTALSQAEPDLET